MTTSYRTLGYFIVAVALTLLLQACPPNDSGGEEDYPPQTNILDVKVQSDTVAPGDTASFTCIIEDSTDKRFRFYWYVDVGEVLNAELYDDNPIVYETEINKVNWVAPQSSGFNNFTVLTANNSKDSTSVETSFVIVVE